ncbi:hypothetical protein AOLI_G00100510 [Acnodon oligacanthus]
MIPKHVLHRLLRDQTKKVQKRRIVHKRSLGSVTEVAAWIITHQAHCGVGMLWACQGGLMRSSPTGLQQSVQR